MAGKSEALERWDKLADPEYRVSVWPDDESYIEHLCNVAEALAETLRDYELGEQFRLLAEHHRQAEHIGQRMADELAKFSDGEHGKERMALVAEWNAHQWPDFEKVV